MPGKLYLNTSPALPSCVTLGSSVPLGEPQSPCLQSGVSMGFPHEVTSVGQLACRQTEVLSLFISVVSFSDVVLWKV